MTISYFLRLNRYASACALCSARVEADRGFCQKNRDSGKWEVICHDCIRTNSRAIPVVITLPDPHIMTGVSVVDRTQVFNIYRCTTCHNEVAWVRSRKTRRFYLANVTKTMNENSDARRVYDFSAHSCKGEYNCS